jgi:hypothetical protein
MQCTPVVHSRAILQAIRQRAWITFAATLLLASCGGGGGGGGGGGDATYDVSVEVVTAKGEPVGGAVVLIAGGSNGRSATTDANGRAQFNGIPAGPTDLAAYRADFYSTYGRRVDVVAGAITPFRLQLTHVTEATPVVLSARAKPSADGSKLLVDLHVAVLGQDGAAISNLPLSSFTMEQDCGGWWYCLMNAQGSYSEDRQFWAGSPDPTAFAFFPAIDTPAMALGLLLDQGQATLARDPDHLRLDALASALGSITAPSVAAIASMRGSPIEPAFSTATGFTSDGASLRTAVASLAGTEGGGPAPAGALADMVSLVGANAPVGPGTPARSVVVLKSDGWGSDARCPVPAYGGTPCLDAANAIATSAQASAVSLTLIGMGDARDYGLSIPARTGGAFVPLTHPAQLSVVAPALDKIVGKSLGYHRLHFEYTGAPGTFEPGWTAMTTLSIQIAPNTFITLSLDVPF